MNFHPCDVFWWRMILADATPGNSWWRAVLCRIRNHPCGVIWYTDHGLEPDMHCKKCGDDLG